MVEKTGSFSDPKSPKNLMISRFGSGVSGC